MRLIVLFMVLWNSASCQTKKVYPELKVNKVKYYPSQSQYVAEFEKSSMKTAFEELRKKLYSILEGGGTIYDLEEYLDKDYFSYSDEKKLKKFIIYKGERSKLEEIQKVWDLKSIKNGLKNPYIFVIQLKDGYVTWEEMDPGKTDRINNPPIQITFKYKDGIMKLSKIGKVYGIP